MPLDSEIKELVEKYKVTLLDDDDQIIDIESQHSRRQLEPIEDGLYFLGMRTDEGEEYELVMTEEKTIEVKNGKILKNEALYKSMNLILSKLDYFYEDMEDDAIIETDGFYKEDDSKGEFCIVFSMVGTSTISEYVEEKEDDSSSGPDGWEDDPRFK
tara:strand:+ start:1721 stop:2191 length:471 start_codon:yes stop_codon:yes gene_type:complete